MTLEYTLEYINDTCPVYKDFGDNAIELENQLLSKCKEDKGLGLSANQVGLLSRVFVIVCGGKEYAAFNPTFHPVGEDTNLFNEGCLSYPGLFLNIKRPAKGRAEWQDNQGEWHQADLDKIEARVFQHELDHLNGIPFVKKVSQIKLDRALKARSKRVKNVLRSIQ